MVETVWKLELQLFLRNQSWIICKSLSASLMGSPGLAQNHHTVYAVYWCSVLQSIKHFWSSSISQSPQKRRILFPTL